MTYHERFRRISPGPGAQSSFRGVKFYLPSDSREGGTRGQVHEYPSSNHHTTQNLGLSVDRFQITAVVMGANYDLARDALISALKLPGPGQLIHRFYGTMQVEVEPGKQWSCVQTQDDGGKATFTIPFVKSGAQKNPTSGTGGIDAVRVAADRAKSFSLASFVARLDTSGIEAVRTNILETIQDANLALTEVNGRVSGALATPTIIAGQIQSFSNNLATLIATPTRIDELADGLYAIVGAIFTVISEAGLALRNNLRQPFEQAAQAQIAARKVISLNRSTRKQVGALNTGATDNDLIIGAMLGQAAAIEAARVAVDMPYDSRDTAGEAREDLSQVLYDLASEAADDDLYASLMDLRAQLSRYLSSAAGNLPAVAEHTPVRTLPALLIAHRIYGDARRCEEIIARNNLKHPGFVAGGIAIKVLADA